MQRASRDVDIQCELLLDHEQPSLAASVESQTTSLVFLDQQTQSEVEEANSSPISELQTVKERIGEFLLQHHELFPRVHEETLADIEQILAVIVKLQDEAKELQR